MLAIILACGESKGIPLGGLDVRVKAAAGQEGDDGQRHGGSRDGKADSPGHRVLDVHDDRDSQAAAPVDGKVEPVEEALLFQAVLHVTCSLEGTSNAEDVFLIPFHHHIVKGQQTSECVAAKQLADFSSPTEFLDS